MKLKIQLFLGSAAFAVVLSAPFSGAQQKQTPVAQGNAIYDPSREVALLGTVVSYTAESSLPPSGPHVLIQTSSGNVDVHLGSAAILNLHHLTLSAGDSVRIIGESVAYGGSTMFAARIIQKGLQAISVRNTKGYVMNVPELHVAGGAR